MKNKIQLLSLSTQQITSILNYLTPLKPLQKTGPNSHNLSSISYTIDPHFQSIHTQTYHLTLSFPSKHTDSILSYLTQLDPTLLSHII